MKKVYIIVGSMRPHWLGKRIAQWVRVTAKTQTKAAITIVDADDIILSDSDRVSRPGERRKYDLADADGYIVIAPEYESGKETVVRSVVAALEQAESQKPVAFVSYGLHGGSKLVDKLRAQVRRLDLAPLRNAVHIAKPWDIIDESGELHDADQEKVLRHMIKQLSGWMATASPQAV